MSAARKITAWIGTAVASPLLLAHLGVPVAGAALAIVIILAGLYCWTVSNKGRCEHLAMILSARQPADGQAQPATPRPDRGERARGRLTGPWHRALAPHRGPRVR